MLMSISTLLFAAKNTWIENPEKTYPSSVYITGVGSGESRAAAESAAKFNLCQILGEKISAEQNVSKIADSKGTNLSSYNLSVQEKVIFDKIVGITIKESCTQTEKKEVFQDGKLKKTKVKVYYALAVLKKSEAINYYSTQVSNLAMEIFNLEDKADKELGTMQSVALMKKAVSIAEENEYNLQILTAIQGTRQKVLYTSVQNVKNKLTSTAESVRICLNVNGDDSGKVLSAFQSVLKDFGFTTTKTNDYSYLLNATVAFEDVDGSNLAANAQNGSEYKYIRYSLLSEYSSLNDKNVLFPFEASGREGHVSQSQAKNRAVSKIVTKINEEFASTLENYLDQF